MLIRFVKLTIKADKTDEFKSIFATSQQKIQRFDGCQSVHLLQEPKDPRIFFTHSIWKDEAALDAYRHSAFFEATWKKTKTLFDARAEAWSLTEIQ
jgi:quinol monooxygenase YgiN